MAADYGLAPGPWSATDVNAPLTGLIGVVATLPGSFTAYIIQSRTVKRALHSSARSGLVARTDPMNQTSAWGWRVSGSASDADSALPHLVTGHQAIPGIGPELTARHPHRPGLCLDNRSGTSSCGTWMGNRTRSLRLGRLAACGSARTNPVGRSGGSCKRLGDGFRVEPGECSRAQQSCRRR